MIPVPEAYELSPLRLLDLRWRLRAWGSAFSTLKDKNDGQETSGARRGPPKRVDRTNSHWPAAADDRSHVELLSANSGFKFKVRNPGFHTASSVFSFEIF